SWEASLGGETLHAGSAEGILLGGAMTLVEATLGTPWEIDTASSILILEDRGMKPYQVDRVLLHLKHAGTFEGVRAMILGDFPESRPPVSKHPSVSRRGAPLSRPPTHPGLFRRAGRAYGAAYADIASWCPRPPHRRRSRYTEDPGANRPSMTPS